MLNFPHHNTLSALCVTFCWHMTHKMAQLCQVELPYTYTIVLFAQAYQRF